MFKPGDVVQLTDAAVDFNVGWVEQRGYLFVFIEEYYLTDFCLCTSIASGKQVVLHYSELEKADV